VQVGVVRQKIKGEAAVVAALGDVMGAAEYDGASEACHTERVHWRRGFSPGRFRLSPYLCHRVCGPNDIAELE